MEWVETTGRTVDEAKELALDQLGVDDQEAEFEVVEEGKAGLFGLVRKEARVRARVRPTQPRPKAERRRSKRRDSGDRARKGSGSKNGGGDDTGTTTPSGDDTPAAATKASVDGPSKARKSGGGRKPSAAKPAGAKDRQTAASGADRSTKNKENGEPMDEITLDQQVEVMEDFLDGLVEAFGLDGQISSEQIDDDTVEIHIDGDDLGLLIGPKGQTLASVQELARTVAQRRLAGPHQGRVRLDVGGYRKRRSEALTRFALQVADDVKASGTPKVLEPMSPPDRKVVHDALNDVDGVRTASEGEDSRRRVVVLPD